MVIDCCFHQNKGDVIMEITNKKELKIGDVIRFHNWGVGGFFVWS